MLENQHLIGWSAIEHSHRSQTCTLPLFFKEQLCSVAILPIKVCYIGIKISVCIPDTEINTLISIKTM